jgi:hypothetical protein
MKELKVIVAGGREFNDYDRLSADLFNYAESLGDEVGMSIVTGMARGADALAYRFTLNESVKVYEFKPDWDGLGKRAGFVRNAEMAEFADRLIAYWDGESRGTAHMIQTMQKMGKPVTVISY